MSVARKVYTPLFVEWQTEIPPQELPEWVLISILDQPDAPGSITQGANGDWFINSVRGLISLNEGDYLLLGSNGVPYSVEPEVFLTDYEIVKDSE